MRILLLVILSSMGMAQAENSQLIQAKAYLDVVNGEWIEPANVLVVGGRIEAINPDQYPADAHIIDLTHQYLLPGLTDMHTHLDLDYVGNFDAIITQETATKGALRGAKNAELTLMGGFTTVRNVGSLHITDELIGASLAQAVEQGWIKGPRIIPAGHMITILGGHGDVTQGLVPSLLEPTHKMGVVSGTDEAIKAVRYQIKQGAKVIKMHATSGVLSLEDTVGAQQLSDAEMRAIVEEANRHHYKVAAHAHGTEGIIAAVKAGAASIEHGSMIDDEAMKLMKQQGVYLVPTSGLVDFVLNDVDKMPPITAQKARETLPLAQANLKKAIKAKVKIALGTDSPLIPHGKNAYELSAMMSHGMTALEAIQSATINGADLIGINDIGQIKTGYKADIIAVTENPLDDIKTLEDVRFVMKDGVIYKNQGTK
ncbi:metal-dependent hydrolase family protein [Marinicella litoralis]|uniref:Imidazolonepropionase-like amidohydrolase n=1 Tax=Marinicella litoralis TaxID=644220 RepID=A0A4V3DHB8_9GAMM|nr:amidohydrolase family protein [Marinicella litoralis]TDR17571.1 imidazolonepropionase-like amidohydrolase [Marinicella litoralis]